ncbi:unnamed protein product (macronuclear) [Paramecium tetraurelia]|uniref:Uncharacterized protein n=1 Tax=Paramecium tetraurelia TaxID=5888 RepID=A0EED2_PARTE|nr:uncharacterized protein GSPATT00025995001 [Paramecium tetraurelia]CAK93650.1 unnamed protein product [Paramecium tetraurelia]|eukprot:XP_001461046.1 hypothetical protein (macronuclear) [Paramecium tetraurelia strain d4-2]
MTLEYHTPANQTYMMNSNHRLLNFKAVVSQQNQTDVSKSDFKISFINKIKKSNDHHYKVNKNNEGSYSKLAESLRNSSNQNNMVEVKIIDIPKQNVLTTKNQDSHQNIMTSQNHQVKKQSLKINSERNKVAFTKPIQKHNSFHAKESSDIQTNLRQNVPKKLYDVHDEIKKIIKDDNKLEKAVKIYNTLKQLVQQQSIFQSREVGQKDYKNRIIQ